MLTFTQVESNEVMKSHVIYTMSVLNQIVSYALEEFAARYNHFFNQNFRSRKFSQLSRFNTVFHDFSLVAILIKSLLRGDLFYYRLKVTHPWSVRLECMILQGKLLHNINSSVWFELWGCCCQTNYKYIYFKL